MPVFIDENKEVKTLHTPPTYPKEVYLTFDDGPSINNTKKIVNILNENGVKATFFIIGTLAEENSQVFEKLKKSNMCIACHTYSHDYKTIYKNPESYIEDLQKCNKLIQNATSKKAVPYIRIPGGAYNKVSSQYTMEKIRDTLRRKNINYVGWNVCANDALGKNVPAYKIKNNVMDQTKKISKNTDIIVLLMHDSYYKKTTVDALPDIIKFYKEEGYLFKTFDEISPCEYQELVKQKIINK
nr:polysaccharide deacetylase family protein [Clostridium aestuarii]